MSDVKQNWKAIQIPFEQITALSDQRQCFELSEREVAMLLSQTQYFYWATRWSKAGGLTSGDKQLISRLAATLEAHLLGTDTCDNVCFDYPMSASIIDIAPSNPYTQPGYVPDGYVVPAWTIATGPILGTSIQSGDIIPSAPTASIVFPHIRVSFTGEAEIELHYVSTPGGGMLQTQKDGDIRTLGYTDLDADIISIPPEENTEESVLEFKFEGTGAHFLDATMLPRINDELEFLGYGGALRKIVMCGQNLECVDMPFDVRQNPDSPCQLDKSTDEGETWEGWANLRLCAPVLVNLGGGVIGVQLPDGTVVGTTTGDPTYDGRDHAPPPAPRGGSASDNKCIAAANAVNVLVTLHATVMQTINVPWELSIAAAIAGLLISLLFLPIALGIIVTIIGGGFLAVLSGLTFGDFDSTTQDTLRCILDCAATDADGVVTFDYTSVHDQVDALSTGPDIWNAIARYLEIVGESGLNLAGATTAITEADCSGCGCSWCHEWTGSDLATVWGYSGAALTYSIHLDPGTSINVRHIEFDYVVSAGGSGGDSSVAFSPDSDYGHKVIFNSPIGSSGTASWDGDIASSQPTIWANTNNTAGTTVDITRILMRGCSASPYADNCTLPDCVD